MRIISLLVLLCFFLPQIALPAYEPVGITTVKPPVYKKNLKHRIATWILKKKLKKFQGEKSRGKTAMIFGIIALGVLIVPYLNLLSLPLAIIALLMGYKARRENPEDRQARTAIILGWVGIGIFVASLFVALAIIALWAA